VVVKKARVDVLMVPVVNWLNDFEAVQTHYCCQGEPDPVNLDELVWEVGNREAVSNVDKPYVLWTCSDAVTLATVLDRLDLFGTTEVDWSKFQSRLRYTTRFYSQTDLKQFIERLA
jgi:hypothetical protein